MLMLMLVLVLVLALALALVLVLVDPSDESPGTAKSTVVVMMIGDLRENHSSRVRLASTCAAGSAFAWRMSHKERGFASHEVGSAVALASALGRIQPEHCRTAAQATAALESALRTVLLGRFHRLHGVQCSIPRRGVIFAVAEQACAGDAQQLYLAVRCFLPLRSLFQHFQTCAAQAQFWLRRCDHVHPGM